MQRNGTQVQVRHAAVPRYGPLSAGINDKGSVIVHTPAHFPSQSAGHKGRERAGLKSLRPIRQDGRTDLELEWVRVSRPSNDRRFEFAGEIGLDVKVGI